jgi:beta-phosphoglucomutase-like phosphatase (HAD superfamily)
VPASECIAFEDSATGVRAARAAGMSVVAVPSSGQNFMTEDSRPHLVLGGLAEFGVDTASMLARLRTAAT